MGIDEKIFGHLYRQYLKLISPLRKNSSSPGRVLLAPLERRLELLASLLNESRINVRACDDEGGLEGDILFLPAHCDYFASESLNLLFYLHRIVWTTVCLKFGSPSRPPATVKELGDCINESYPMASDFFAGLWTAFYDLPQENRDFPLFFGKKPTMHLPSQEALSEGIRGGNPDSREKLNAPPLQLRAKTAYRPELIQLDVEEQNPVNHAFEKVQTAEEYFGSNRQKDGSDELADHADAINELKLNKVIRSGETSKTTLYSEAWIESMGSILPDSSTSDSRHQARKCLYPEWNERLRKYKSDWCTLFESVVAVSPTEKTAVALRNPGFRRRLERLRNRLASQKKLTDGDDLDIDSLVTFWSDPVSRKCTTTPKIYSRKKNLNRDWSTLVLMDGSLSTDAWVKNQRVMDVIKSGVTKICEPLSELSLRLGVAAFHSNTRKECRFEWIKQFSEQWKIGCSRLESIEPKGYTRIGPALRHATEVLKKENSKTKLILLISDSKPSDFDPYEGSYGVFDVKKAVQEAYSHSIYVRNISVSEVRHPRFATMYGAKGYECLSRPSQFEDKFMKIFEELFR